MAKGKKQAAPTKKKPVLAKRFKCPFCANDDCEAAERGEVAAARPGENRRQQNMKNVVHDTEKDYDDDDEEEEDRVENKKSAVARGQEISNATLGLDDSDDDSDA
eukprot:scaffold5926_cov75-Cyclotella_meneghiniana.AAC.2